MSNDFMNSAPGEPTDFTGKSVEEFAVWADGWWVQVLDFAGDDEDVYLVVGHRGNDVIDTVDLVDSRGKTDRKHPHRAWVRVRRFNEIQEAFDAFCAESQRGFVGVEVPDAHRQAVRAAVEGRRR